MDFSLRAIRFSCLAILVRSLAPTPKVRQCSETERGRNWREVFMDTPLQEPYLTESFTLVAGSQKLERPRRMRSQPTQMERGHGSLDLWIKVSDGKQRSLVQSQLRINMFS